jgi:hypothetical protein
MRIVYEKELNNILSWHLEDSISNDHQTRFEIQLIESNKKIQFYNINNYYESCHIFSTENSICLINCGQDQSFLKFLQSQSEFEDFERKRKNKFLILTSNKSLSNAFMFDEQKFSIFKTKNCNATNERIPWFSSQTIEPKRMSIEIDDGIELNFESSSLLEEEIKIMMTI